MLHTFEDFCTWMYVVVDDLYQQVAPLFHRPGPAPQCSDSDLLVMALIGEARGWDLETELCWLTSATTAICSPGNPPRAASTAADAS